MRNALLQLAPHRTDAEQRRVLRVAVRQLERADLYLAAVASVGLRDEDAQNAIDDLRLDVEALRRRLVDERSPQAL